MPHDEDSTPTAEATGSQPGDIVWVLLVGEDYGDTDVCGVYSSPEPAVAKAIEGPDYYYLEPHRIDSDEALPSFYRRMGECWRLETDDKAWRGTDPGVGYMLALCDAAKPVTP